MRVALYARVSSDKQAEKDLSIPAQLRALRNYAVTAGHTVIREFVDVAETGRTSDRPSFREMIGLSRLKQPPFEAILVWKLSRFARNREDSIIYKSLLRKRGIQVTSISEPIDDSPSGRMLEGMIEVIDEFYSANLAEEVKRGMRENAMRGYFSGGKPPYGYIIVKTKDGGAVRSTLSIDETASVIVKRIFSDSLEGQGLKEIAKSLNREGFTTVNGKKWATTGIQAILKNEVYTGTLVWGKRSATEVIRVENAWPAIIDRETFHRVQALLKSRSPKIIHPRRVPSEYLLSGMIKCEVCGKAMSGHSAKSGQFFYYRCTNAMKRGSDECPGHWIPKAKIEGFVIDKIRNYILTEENLLELVNLTGEALNTEISETKTHIKSLEEHIGDIDSRLEHLYNALEKGSFTSDELAPRIRTWRARREELETTKQNIELEARSKVFEMPDIESVRNYVEDLKAVLGSASIVEQRAFLKSFIKDIQVGADHNRLLYHTDATKEL